MSKTREAYETVIAFIKSVDGFNVSDCRRGYPDFGRSNLQTPVMALYYAGSDNEAVIAALPRRIGKSQTVVDFTLGIYEANEVGLLDKVDRLRELRIKRHVLTTTGGDTVVLAFGEDVREPPDPDAPKELRHLVEVPVQLALGG